MLNQAAATGTLVIKQLTEFGTSTVFYTVPSGKKFVGHFVGESQIACTIKINGKDMRLGYGASAAAPVPLILPAGTVVSTSSSYPNGTLVGIES